jgi:hypothetical protein
MRAIVKYRKQLVLDFWGEEIKFKYILPPELPGTIDKRLSNWGVGGTVAYAVTFDDSTYLPYLVNDPCSADDIAETFPLEDSRTLSSYGFKPGQPIIMRFTKSFVPTRKPRVPDRIVSPWMFFDPYADPGSAITEKDIAKTDLSNVPHHQRQAHMEQLQKKHQEKIKRENSAAWREAEKRKKVEAAAEIARFEKKRESYWVKKEDWAKQAKQEELDMSWQFTKGRKKIEDILCHENAAACGEAAAQLLLRRGHSKADWPTIAAAAGAAAGAAVGLATKGSPSAGTPEECNTAAALAAAVAAVDVEAERQLSTVHPKYNAGKRDISYIGEVAGKAATWAGGSEADVGKAVAVAVFECDGSAMETVIAVGMQVGVFVEQVPRDAQQAHTNSSLAIEAATAAATAAQEEGARFPALEYGTLDRDTVRVAVEVGTILCKGEWSIVGECLRIGVDLCVESKKPAFDEETKQVFFEEAREELLQVVVHTMIKNRDPPEQAATSISDALEAAGVCQPHWDEVTRLAGWAASHVRLHNTAAKRGICVGAEKGEASKLAEDEEDYDEWAEEVMNAASLVAPLHILEFSAQAVILEEDTSVMGSPPPAQRRAKKGKGKTANDSVQLPNFEVGDFLRDDRNTVLYRVFDAKISRGGKTLELIARCEVTKQNQIRTDDADFNFKPHLLLAYTGKTTGGRHEQRKVGKNGQALPPARLVDIDRNEDMEDDVLLGEVQAQAAATVVIGLLQKPKLSIAGKNKKDRQSQDSGEDDDSAAGKKKKGKKGSKQSPKGKGKQSPKGKRKSMSPKKKGGDIGSDAEGSCSSGEEGALGSPISKADKRSLKRKASKRASKRKAEQGGDPKTPVAAADDSSIEPESASQPVVVERRHRRKKAPVVLTIEDKVLKLAEREAKKAGDSEEAVEYVIYDLLVRTFEVRQPDPGRKALGI